MAERRMFAKSVIDSDAFLELPVKCQLLYFHLGMRADDDGFVNKARSVLRLIGCTEADMKTLVDAQYLISFPSGVVVIRHWKVHNYIRRDSYKETLYKSEKNRLTVDVDGVYNLAVTGSSQVCDRSVTEPLQGCDGSVTGLSTQDRLGKDRLGKDRLGKVSSDQVRLNQESTGGCALPEHGAMARPPTATEVMIYVKQKKYHVDPERFVSFYNKNGWIEQGKTMTDWKKAVDLWQQRKW